MSDRPTPETDDLLNTIRKLECELAEAVKARDHNRTCVKRLTEELDEAREQIAKANSEREQLWNTIHDAYQPLIAAGNYELSERIRFLLERGPQAYSKKFGEEQAAGDNLTERENDTQAELAAWELLKVTRDLARELRDAMKAITPYIGYPSTPTDVVYQFKNALAKSKEVLP